MRAESACSRNWPRTFVTACGPSARIRLQGRGGALARARRRGEHRDLPAPGCDVILLRPLPVASPEELAESRSATGRRARELRDLTKPRDQPVWEAVRDRQQTFSGVAAWAGDGFDLASGGESRPASVPVVSGGFFDVLGVRPEVRAGPSARGRPARRERGGRRGDQQRFLAARTRRRTRTGRPHASRLDGTPVEIVGVAPRASRGSRSGSSFDVALPIAAKRH